MTLYSIPAPLNRKPVDIKDLEHGHKQGSRKGAWFRDADVINSVDSLVVLLYGAKKTSITVKSREKLDELAGGRAALNLARSRRLVRISPQRGDVRVRLTKAGVQRAEELRDESRSRHPAGRSKEHSARKRVHLQLVT